jgi:hypothetical protein
MVDSPNFVFETRDLDICRDDTVEIHPAAWEAVAMSISTLSVRYQFQDLGSSSSPTRGELVSHPHARLPISHNHRKAYGTTQLRSTRMLSMETAPTSPGVRRMHPQGPQMKPPSPKTTLVPLPPATMTFETACRPTLARKN